ncbi:hypothetical protein [Marinicellulosiphila megalodicopiae]|uniref:hypothetical protein n=1 Tax=Marinicellulosiphila megalodicopiae TaxID=2724896 RepID=UPI003BB15D0A
MRKILTIGLFMLIVPFAFSKQSISDAEALNFFNLYQKMIQERSTNVMQLLSKDVQLYSKTLTANGTTYVTQYDIEEVLKFIRAVQAFIYLNKEESEFEKIALTRKADQVIIRAQRFSTTNCYLDKEYYVIIERERNFIKVMEEMITIDQTKSCESLENIDLKIK